MNQLVVQLDPEVFCAERDLGVVDHPPQGHALEILKPVPIRPELWTEARPIEQTQDRWEGLDVTPVEGLQETLKRRDLGGLHGEGVGPRAQDGVEQHHQG